MRYKIIPQTITVSDFRNNLSEYVEKAGCEPVVISVDRGKDTRVLMSGEDYNKMIELLEDEADARELERLVKEDKGEYISWEEVKKKYGR